MNKQISRGDSIMSVGGQSVGGQSVGGQSIGGASISSTPHAKGKISTQASVQEEPTFTEQSSAAVESSQNTTLLHRTPSATS